MRDGVLGGTRGALVSGRPVAAAPASRRAAAPPACAPCRSMADRTSRPEIGGLADSAQDLSSLDERSVALSNADASARSRHHPAASLVNSLSVPTPRRHHRATARRPSPASSNPRRCSQSFGLLATKISARRTAPHAHVRSEYGKSGDSTLRVKPVAGGGRPTMRWSRQNRTNSIARHRFSAFSHGAAPDRSRSPPTGCPD